MTIDPDKRLTLSELLNAANKTYQENYLSEYFDPATGDAKEGSGDSLAEFIVRELRETFDKDATRGRQTKSAIRALERANIDIQKAINGLRELDLSAPPSWRT